jgi:hypothetical protein
MNRKKVIVRVDNVDHLNYPPIRGWANHKPLLISDWLRIRPAPVIYDGFNVADAQSVSFDSADIPVNPAEVVGHRL